MTPKICSGMRYYFLGIIYFLNLVYQSYCHVLPLQIKLLLTYSCHADTFTGRMGKVQTIVKKLVNEDILNQMYSSRKDLAKVLAIH